MAQGAAAAIEDAAVLSRCLAGVEADGIERATPGWFTLCGGLYAHFLGLRACGHSVGTEPEQSPYFLRFFYVAGSVNRWKGRRSLTTENARINHRIA